MRRITTEAYEALREALAVIMWNKRPFESFLRTALRDQPGLLAGLNFSEPKRIVADEVVEWLVTRENTHQDTTLRLMLEVADIGRFPNIEQLGEPDRTERLGEARAAVSRLKELTGQFADQFAEQERAGLRRETSRAQNDAVRRFETDVEQLKDRFLAMQAVSNPRERGYDFERLLSDLFNVFDLDPRLAYRLDTEQIDGSLSFDTDDYILEAKWIGTTVDRASVDVFAEKVRRRGKNALGLFVAVNGFARTALSRYREATPFITMDGNDLYLVLDGRLRLDDLLKAKRRHANETGSCHLSATEILD